MVFLAGGGREEKEEKEEKEKKKKKGGRGNWKSVRAHASSLVQVVTMLVSVCSLA